MLAVFRIDSHEKKLTSANHICSGTTATKAIRNIEESMAISCAICLQPLPIAITKRASTRPHNMAWLSTNFLGFSTKSSGATSSLDPSVGTSVTIPEPRFSSMTVDSSGSQIIAINWFSIFLALDSS